MNNDVHFSHKTDEWPTPKAFFRRLNEEFHFDLDVCATKENAKCPKFYTKEDDGLSLPWSKMNWCNPPYSDIKRWAQQARREQFKGHTTVMLMPARTDTVFFHDHIYNQPNVDVRFVKGRWKFGDGKNSAPFPSMLVIFRPYHR
jgi:phage N-6-adenine-methyltransferase